MMKKLNRRSKVVIASTLIIFLALPAAAVNTQSSQQKQTPHDDYGMLARLFNAPSGCRTAQADGLPDPDVQLCIFHQSGTAYVSTTLPSLNYNYSITKESNNDFLVQSGTYQIVVAPGTDSYEIVFSYSVPIPTYGTYYGSGSTSVTSCVLYTYHWSSTARASPQLGDFYVTWTGISYYIDDMCLAWRFSWANVQVTDTLGNFVTTPGQQPVTGHYDFAWFAWGTTATVQAFWAYTFLGP